MQLSFQTPDCCFTAVLNKGPCTQEIIKYLPINSKVSLWGEEIYFQIGITNIPKQEATIDINAGDVAYWPDGNCICVFFGTTPFSKEDGKPIPAVPVIIIGKTPVIPHEFKKIKSGQPIRVMPVEPKLSAAPVAQKAAERKLSQPEIDALVQQLLVENAKKP